MLPRAPTARRADATARSLRIRQVSVLENHHVAAAFKLLYSKELDWTKGLPLEDYKDFRETVVQMVLGTDVRARGAHRQHAVLAC